MKEEIVLYCANLSVHLYSAIVHRLTVNKDKKAVLIRNYSDDVQEKISSELVKNGVFDKVIFADMIINKKNNFIKSIEDAEKLYLSHFDEEFEKVSVNLSEFDEIYTICDNWDADQAVYLNLKKINYSWIQIMPNYDCVYTRHFDSPFYETIKKYNGYSLYAPYAFPIILNSSDKTKDTLDRNNKQYTIWDINQELRNLTKEHINILFKCFNLSDLSDVSNTSIIIKNSVTMSMWKGRFFERGMFLDTYRGRRNISDAKLLSIMDNTALDYFAPNSKIFVKTHPHNQLTDEQMSEFYDEDVKLFTDAPFELVVRYCELNGIKFNKIIGYISSSLLPLRENTSICNKVYHLGEGFLRLWFCYASIYTCVMYALKLGLKKIYSHDYLSEQVKCIVESLNINMSVLNLKLDEINSYTDSMIIIDCLDNQDVSNKIDYKKIDGSSVYCLINNEFIEEFLPRGLMWRFIPIKIKKEIVKTKCAHVFNSDETVWIYAENPEIRRNTYNFDMKKVLPRLGIMLNVEPISIPSTVNEFMINDMKSTFNNLINEFSVIKNKLDVLTSCINHVDLNIDANSLGEFLKSTNDIITYLNILSFFKNKLIIILSVRDTPGDYLKTEIINTIKGLGFQKFKNELWRMYVGIINCGVVVVNKTGVKPEEKVIVNWSDELKKIKIDIASESWRNGNKSSIVINEIDYSANIRGINMVVIEAESLKVIDSIGFDAHNADNSKHVFIHRKE